MELGALVVFWASVGKTAGCWDSLPALGLEGSLPPGHYPRVAVSWNRVQGEQLWGQRASLWVSVPVTQVGMGWQDQG